jgi:hypothetical protein
MNFPRFPGKRLAISLIAVVIGARAGGEPPPSASLADDTAARREKALTQVDEVIAFSTKLASGALRHIRRAMRESQLAPGVQADPTLLRPHYVAERTRQFQPILTTQLQFIRRIAQPTPEQYQSIKAAGQAALQATVNEYVNIQIKARETRDHYESRRRSEWPDVRKLISDALAEAVQKSLSAEQLKRFQIELRQRAANRKRVTILMVVAKIDKDLSLSAEQRDKLTAVINSNWQEKWDRPLELMEHGEYYFPLLPDERVLPLLSDAQKQIWNRRNKTRHSIGGWTGFGFIQPVTEDQPESADDNGGSP